MIRRPPRSTQSRSSAASDVYKRQLYARAALFDRCRVGAPNAWRRAKRRYAEGGSRRRNISPPMAAAAQRGIRDSSYEEAVSECVGVRIGEARRGNPSEHARWT